MSWTICFIISITILVAAVVYSAIALRKYRSGRVIGPFNMIFAGVFLAVFTGLLPVFADTFVGGTGRIIKICFFDVLQTIQVFTINVGADLILENINSATTSISGIYSTYMTILFFAAPILTFGVLISFFKNALAEMAYFFHFWGDVYVFSELNERSLTLASSIKANHKSAVMAFTDVDTNDESGTDLVEAARELGALCLEKEIDVFKIRRHLGNRRFFLFTISDDESDNVIKGLKLAGRYRDCEDTTLYIFSSGIEGAILLSNAAEGKLKVRRVNEVRSLIYRFLYEDGYSIFQNAILQESGDKKITAVIAGLGQYGVEMLKALIWYCQMDGYTVEIHAFDKDELAEEKFFALCPEIMSDRYNGICVPGEAQYEVYIHSGVDVETKTYAEIIAGLPAITYACVCLGNDSDNIKHAVNLRMLCERCGSKPVIKSIVYSTDKKEALSDITNYRGQSYDIDFIGDIEESYSESVIMNNDVERLSLERHLKWGKEEEFWQYEYNYRSSMASAIHLKARIQCGIPGAHKAEQDLTIEERDGIEMLEHRRWNAYMRSEGYVYSGSPNASSRNDLAKMHHNLVVYDVLSDEEKRKDSSVGTI